MTKTPESTQNESRAHEVDDSPEMTLGDQVRAFRELRGMTVRQLASAIALSPGFISQLENGRTGASLETLKRIAHALGVTLAELVELTPMNHRGVLRKLDRTAIASEGGVTKYVLTKPPVRHLEMYLVEFEPHSSTGDLYSIGDSQEHVLCTVGTLEITVGTEIFTLGEGDSLEFASKIPHGIRNLDETPSEAVWTVAPPLTWQTDPIE